MPMDQTMVFKVEARRFDRVERSIGSFITRQQAEDECRRMAMNADHWWTFEAVEVKTDA